MTTKPHYEWSPLLALATRYRRAAARHKAQAEEFISKAIELELKADRIREQQGEAVA